MKIKRVRVRMRGMGCYMNVRVPVRMSDEEITKALEYRTNLKVTAIKDPRPDIDTDADHRISRDGQLRLVDRNFQPAWSYIDRG